MLPIPHKYSKTFHRRGSKQGVTYQNTSFSGNISLISLERAKISNFELFGSRAFLKKELKKATKVWVKSNLSLAVTKKPSAARMGKGKGNILYWSSLLYPGKPLYDFKSWNKRGLLKTTKRLQKRLSFKSSTLLLKNWWF